jgi:hypothetical protein
VTLKGLTISGDLILGEGVGNGDVTLDGVTVTGRVVVRGGGEDSIRIINKSDVGSIIVGKTGDGGVRVRTEEGCRVESYILTTGWTISFWRAPLIRCPSRRTRRRPERCHGDRPDGRAARGRSKTERQRPLYP